MSSMLAMLAREEPATSGAWIMANEKPTKSVDAGPDQLAVGPEEIDRHQCEKCGGIQTQYSDGAISLCRCGGKCPEEWEYFKAVCELVTSGALVVSLDPDGTERVGLSDEFLNGRSE